MKKILSILVLGFVWFSISFAHEDNIDSIEKCADGKTWDKLSNWSGYSKIDAGRIIKNMGIKNKEADIILDEASDLYMSSLNLSSEAGFFIRKHLEITSYNKPRSKLTLNDLKVQDETILIKYKNMMQKSIAKRKRSEVLADKGYYKYYVSGVKYSVIKNTNLKLKAKSPFYLEIFTECEMEYNKTPNSFLLKYKK